ncbi:MAG TPA: CHAT domain-containing tetratricopeptide repeat protein [Vicinamibacterales bacterium]|nr:CHAT domain-containing tetratricopeptide repeat protein [Vicinamibacterales bacterium]
MTRAAACVFLAAAAFSAQQPASDKDPAAPVVLRPGSSVERNIIGTERHSYDVTLQAGEYAALTVDQRGTDLVVRVLDASGAAVAVVDDEVRKEAREHIAIVADTPRAYRLTVSARYPKLASGPYAIWIDGIRPATDRDRGAYEARTLGTEAAALRTAGKFDDALARATRALALAESSLGAEDAYVSALLTTIAGVQRSKGQPRDAEQSFLRAIGIAETALGRDHPQVGALKETLGVMFNAMDDYARAEPLMVEGTAIVERALGDHPRLATCLMDLALLHTHRGDYPRALGELQRALQVSDRTMSPDEFGAIAIVNNLGDLYVTMNDFDRAQPLVERTLRDIERTMGADNFRVAMPLLNLGVIARERRDYAAALGYLRRAYAVREKTYGKEHADTASLLISIGNVHHAQQDYAAALDDYQQAYDVLERTTGPYSNLTLMALNSAARTFAAKGDVASALEKRAQVEALLDRAITFNLAIGSDREKLAYLEQTFERMGRTISLHLQQAPANVDAANLAATAILHRKGRVLDASLDSRAAIRARLEPGDRTLLDELSTVTTRLSTLALSGPGRSAPAEYRRQLAALDARHEALESQISRHSASFRAETQETTVADLRAALPAASALVEFVVYQPFDPSAATDNTAHGEPRYAAYVIRRDAAVRGIDLGPASRVDAAVARVRDALRDPLRRDVRTLARALDEVVLRPVRVLTGDAAQLLIAPDGALNLLPFETLVDERGRFQVQRYAISYLSSGRDVLRMRVPRVRAGPPLVLADPAFGEGQTGVRPGSDQGRTPSRAADGSLSYFAPLAGTALEAAAIRRLLPRATVLTGAQATKSALRSVTAPSILHVASHAFFLAERPQPNDGAPAGTRGGGVDVPGRDPLLRAGIALAGANLPRQREAGILTALEASTLDLWGTQLVTLSACDTGVGAIRNGEGVYGLRRAFFLAGAETLVMSLWPVSDFVTRGVMTDYYRGLARGLGRDAALRRVQLAMLADPARRHPYYWAAFIQAGDWTPLPGPR